MVPHRLGLVRGLDPKPAIDTKSGRGFVPVIALNPTESPFRNVIDRVNPCTHATKNQRAQDTDRPRVVISPTQLEKSTCSWKTGGIDDDNCKVQADLLIKKLIDPSSFMNRHTS